MRRGYFIWSVLFGYFFWLSYWFPKYGWRAKHSNPVFSGAWLQAHGRDRIYYLFVMAEELLEMAGAITFIYAFAIHIDWHLSFSVRITLT